MLINQPSVCETGRAWPSSTVRFSASFAKMDAVKVILSVALISMQCISVNCIFRFANHYASHMVLQRAPQQAHIWGYRNVGQKVQITVKKETSHISDSTVYRIHAEYENLYRWHATLPAIEAGGPYAILATGTTNGSVETIKLDNVLFGDVWLCGGQSNMVLTVSMTFEAKKEIDLAANYPNVRVMTVDRYLSQTPVDELSYNKIMQPWTMASTKSIGGPVWRYFSAICWMFGRRLYDTYQVPIGLVSSCYGGSSVETWSSPDALAKCGAKGGPPAAALSKPTVLWNGMINPLLTMTIYGAIWYQGEANSYTPGNYNCTFPAMVADWRQKFLTKSKNTTLPLFPFGLVQLSTLGLPMRYQSAQALGFPVVRWKQTAEYGYVPNPQLPNVFMAVSLDLPDNVSPYGSIHPRDKTDVAERLLLGAKSVAYKEPGILWTGPLLKAWGLAKYAGLIWQVYIYFEPKSLGPEGLDLRSLEGFEVQITSASQKPQIIASWHHVNITSVKSNYVSLLTSTYWGETITGIRYNWSQQPCFFKQCALYSANLPAPPFVAYKPEFSVNRVV